MEQLIHTLKAAGEPSRLRILAILEHHELTVGELVDVLRQSQPRVSRHLRVLSEAGLVRRYAEGTSAFYRLHRDGPHAALVRSILDASDPTNEHLARDDARLRQIRVARTEQATRYFRDVASDWDRMRNRHVPDADVEAELLQLLEQRRSDQLCVDTLVDLGTGTGRILEVAGAKIRRGLGIDLSRDMLAVARNKLESAELHNCHVRLGDVYGLDLPAESADVVVLHHVLHFLDDPNLVIEEAARIMAPDGVLVVIDFAPHTLSTLRDDYAHVRMGFSTAELQAWSDAAGLADLCARDFVPEPPDLAGAETLTVTMWTATRPADTTSPSGQVAPAPSTRSTQDLEVA